MSAHSILMEARLCPGMRQGVPGSNPSQAQAAEEARQRHRDEARPGARLVAAPLSDLYPLWRIAPPQPLEELLVKLPRLPADARKQVQGSKFRGPGAMERKGLRPLERRTRLHAQLWCLLG